MGFIAGLITNRTTEMRCITGRGQKSAAIFIHGLLGPEHAWKQADAGDSLVDLMADDADFAGYDIYTFGPKSSPGAFQYDFKYAAQVLRDKLDNDLSQRELLFIVHSHGGLVILQYFVDCLAQGRLETVKRVQGVVSLTLRTRGFRLSGLLRGFSRDIRTLAQEWSRCLYAEDGQVQEVLDGIRLRVIRAVYDQGAGNWLVAPEQLRLESLFSAGEALVDGSAERYRDAYSLIKDFAVGKVKDGHGKKQEMVLWIHGWHKQKYSERYHHVLDWSGYFNKSGSHWQCPTAGDWSRTLIPELYSAYRSWAAHWIADGKVRIYSSLSPTGGLLVGSHFSHSSGVRLEVVHNGDIWHCQQYEALPAGVNTETARGNSQSSARAVVILSTKRDIKQQVAVYLRDEQEQAEYSLVVHVIPAAGLDSAGLATGSAAVRYAKGVQAVFEDLQDQGLQEVWLFLHMPAAAALVLGHYLSPGCAIQTFEYTGDGYIFSCVLPGRSR